NHGNWLSTAQHLNDFMQGNDVHLERAVARFLESFKECLLTSKTRKSNRDIKLNQNSILSYFNKVRAALREAYNSRMIKENPALRVKSVKAAENHRQFLTFEALQRLAPTPFEMENLKKAFLFSSM